MTTDTAPLAGIACMCLGVLCLTINDALAKWLGAFYPVTEVVFFRMLVALPLVVALGLAMGGRRALTTRRPLMHLGRGLLATCATFAFFLGLTLLPLAETTAIVFAAPLFVTLLAIPLLGERPRAIELVVTGLGFVGVLLIVQPGTAAFAPAGLVPLITAVSYSLLMLSARWFGRSETIWAHIVYVTAVPLAVSAALLPAVWVTPELAHVPFFLGLGASGGAAMTLITQAFRIGSAARVAPFDYTALIWAALFGWLLWGEVPTPATALGATIITACGLFLAWWHTHDRRRGGDPPAIPRGEG